MLARTIRRELSACHLHVQAHGQPACAPESFGVTATTGRRYPHLLAIGALSIESHEIAVVR